MSSTPNVRAEDLLAHAEWVRSLARRLVADESDAADLVQDTWVAALRNPPAKSRPLRPWLGRVVRNFAWRRLRSAARRGERELVAAKPERMPPESDAVARLESQRTLVDTLLALEEPLRTTLVERYLEERSAAEIARRHDVPASTVRWRAKRGLDRMREVLDERHGGDRSTWVLALIPLAAPPVGVSTAPDGSALAGSPLLTGVVTMNAILKTALVVGGLVAATLGWRALRSDSSDPIVPVAVAAPSPDVVPAELQVVEHPEAVASPPEAVATHRMSAALADAVPLAPEVSLEDAAVHARFLDEWGRPLQGVVLAKVDEDATSSALGESGVSGADGRVVFAMSQLAEDAYLFPTKLVARAAGFATVFFSPVLQRGEPTWLGDVVLRPGGRITGVVLDQDREPLPGATVELADAELPPGEIEYLRLEGPYMGRRGVSVVTDAEGRFAIEGVAVGGARVWANATGMRWSISDEVQVMGDRDVVQEFVLQPLGADEAIHGIVLDPAGNPLASARLLFEYRAKGRSGSHGMEVEPDGTFSIVLKIKGEQWISASDSEGRFAPSERLAVFADGGEIVLQLQELAQFELRVRDEAGEPIARFDVDVSYVDGGSQPTLSVDEESGLASVRVARKAFSMEVSSVGFESFEFEPLGPELPTGVECVLVPAAGLRGRVLAGGKPVAGADVGLYGIHGERRRVMRNGLRCWLEGHATSEAVTDTEGAFLLPMPEEGAFVVRASQRGYADTEVAVDASAPPRELSLALGAGGAIEGRVQVSRGVNPTGSIVLAHRGVGQPMAKRVGPDGVYRFERLVPGRWEVQLSDSEPSYSSVTTHAMTSKNPVEPFSGNCVVVEGETTIHDLDLADLEPCVVRGLLRSPGGLLEGDWTAAIWPDMTVGVYPRTDLPSTKLAPDGAFEVSSSRRGMARLAVRSSSGTLITSPIMLAAGEVRWERDWTTGRLAGKAETVPSGVGTPFYLVHRDNETTACVPLRPDEWGNFELDEVPAGTSGIVRWQPGHEAAAPWTWDVLSLVEVEAGRTRTVSLE